MVDPAYQRMGAGRLLVKWGLAEAEKMGVDVSYRTQPQSGVSADQCRLLLKGQTEVVRCTLRKALMARITYVPCQRSSLLDANRRTGG
jgi:GNAT superfamily N-acetyltransferase